MKTVETSFGKIIEDGPVEILSDHATEFMLKHLKIARKSVVAEAGCGTGVLCIYASIAGAAKVYGSDIDKNALDAARENARRNSIDNTVFIHGDLLEPINETLDTVIALLPHKPAPRPFNHRYYGGDDGTDLLLKVIEQAGDKLVQNGQLYLYLNSIANPNRVLTFFREKFLVQPIAEKKRYFTKIEFDGLTPGMFDYLKKMRAAGKAEFNQDERGLYFWARIYKGQKK